MLSQLALDGGYTHQSEMIKYKGLFRAWIEESIFRVFSCLSRATNYDLQGCSEKAAGLAAVRCAHKMIGPWELDSHKLIYIVVSYGFRNPSLQKIIVVDDDANICGEIPELDSLLTEPAYRSIHH